MDLKLFRENQVNIETGFGLKLPECPFKKCACPTAERCEPHRKCFMCEIDDHGKSEKLIAVQVIFSG